MLVLFYCYVRIGRLTNLFLRSSQYSQWYSTVVPQNKSVFFPYWCTSWKDFTEVQTGLYQTGSTVLYSDQFGKKIIPKNIQDYEKLVHQFFINIGKTRSIKNICLIQINTNSQFLIFENISAQYIFVHMVLYKIYSFFLTNMNICFYIILVYEH